MSWTHTLIGVVAALPAVAQVTQHENHRFSAPAPQASDRLGRSLAACGSFVAIGMELGNGGAGGVHVFRTHLPGEWVHDAELLGSSSEIGDLFGSRVVISETELVASAPLDDDAGLNAGALFVFERQSGHWVEVQKLTRQDAAENDQLGGSLALAGDRLVVGVLGFDSPAGMNSGAVVEFRRGSAGWVEVGLIRPDMDPGTTAFGHDVALAGDTLVVGAPSAASPGIVHGAAYVFEHAQGAWTQTDRLVPAIPWNDQRFGWSVSIHTGTIAAGGPFSFGGFTARPGAVHMFERDQQGSWQAVAELSASDGFALNLFGNAVDVEHDALVVGAVRDDANGPVAGSAYAFRRSASGWGETAKLQGSDTSALDKLGVSVVIEGGNAIAGGEFADNPSAVDSGAVYLFELTIGDSFCASTSNSTGSPASLTGTGSLLALDRSLMLRARSLPADQFGYFLVSREPDFVPQPPGSVGVLCLGSPPGRFAGHLASTGSVGEMRLRVDTAHLPLTPPAAVNPGEQWYFQGWFRDVGGTSNFTDGLTIHFE